MMCTCTQADTQRLNKIEAAMRAWVVREFGARQEAGFAVDKDGVILPGCRAKNFPYRSLRDAIDNLPAPAGQSKSEEVLC